MRTMSEHEQKVRAFLTEEEHLLAVLPPPDRGQAVLVKDTSKWANQINDKLIDRVQAYFELADEIGFTSFLVQDGWETNWRYFREEAVREIRHKTALLGRGSATERSDYADGVAAGLTDILRAGLDVFPTSLRELVIDIAQAEQHVDLRQTGQPGSLPAPDSLVDTLH